MTRQHNKEANMIRNPRTRRTLSLLLMATGGLLLFLAPEGIWIGALLLGLGAALEAAGMLMQRGS
ncbi:MAG: hypothetical protein B7Y41_14535 [Hydrogenophilales bacterium 28-61-23]|nr:MAG: hypothetical protein B7Y41_14535 [Hydrogenophilales bacterium 28-61-23]